MEAMEYGLVVDPNTSGEPEVANVDDPWAIVELVDDSKPWSGKEPIYTKVQWIFYVSNFRPTFN